MNFVGVSRDGWMEDERIFGERVREALFYENDSTRPTREYYVRDRARKAVRLAAQKRYDRLQMRPIRRGNVVWIEGCTHEQDCPHCHMNLDAEEA